ncbi:ABC transporter permease [Pseudoalteromonas denitrificans]|uniref:Duplicated orphan permease n=1 Tax=Pseudoalteromonas denitrificans DSM 6059 TaxID=1123010 RepID=A0A1I1R3L1_9GAMM|nr:ABC transporter permease [Pseudoalteromonas denitrificans]SFD28885.1 duplicated orphan permease [Pseudoalteromonas denitrificans DSM 6059]
MNYIMYLIKQAWQSLTKTPGFIVSVVTTMGFTLGALLCVLTLAYVMLMKPLPYPEQEKLYRVVQSQIMQNGQVDNNLFTYPGLIHFYKNQTHFSEAALIHYDDNILTSLPKQPSLKMGYVTPKWFSLLDIPMARGRQFEQTEQLDSHNPVAVISFDTWQNEFNGDEDILSQKIAFSGVSFSIVGVISDTFIEPEIEQRGLKTQVWLPWDYNLDTSAKESWGNIIPLAAFVGKLNSQQSIKQIEQEITPAENQIWRDNVGGVTFLNDWTLQMKLHSFNSLVLGGSHQVIYFLLAGVFGLVIIASANIANLFISRIAQQQHSLAIRAAMGANSKQLFNALLVESGILMLLSICIALVIAVCGFYILQHYLSDVLPRVAELRLNRFSFLSAIIIVMSLAYFFAKVSAKTIKYKTLNLTLQSSGKGNSAQVPKKTRQVLVITQVAIAATLIFVNANLFKHALDSLNEDAGFETHNLSYLNLVYSGMNWPEYDAFSPIMTDIKAQIISRPEVEMISHSSSPLSRFWQWPINDLVRKERYTIFIKSIADDYFELLGQPLIDGENFSTADIKDGNNVWIINEALANHLSPNASAVGINVNPGNDQVYSIKGVVKNIKQPNQIDQPFRVYGPSDLSQRSLLIKFKSNQALSREQLVEVIQQSHKSMVIEKYESLSQTQDAGLFTQKATAITTAVLASLTFLLASLGLYGVMSYSTQIRRFEIGTRLAIGAKRKTLILMIIKDNSQSVLIGLVFSILIMLGLVISFNNQLERYVNWQLLPTVILTFSLIVLITLIACYLPLRNLINRSVIHALRAGH